MSVPAPLRRPSKMDVHVKAALLYKYTMEVTSNPNKFDPAYSDLASNTVKLAHQICLLAYEANDIYVNKDPRDEHGLEIARKNADKRRELQNEALAKCKLLAYDINICREVYGRSEKKTKYWIGRVMEVKNLIYKWREANTKEYSHLWESGHVLH